MCSEKPHMQVLYVPKIGCTWCSHENRQERLVVLNMHENWFHPSFLGNLGNLKEIITYKGIQTIQSTSNFLSQTEQVLWVTFVNPELCWPLYWVWTRQRTAGFNAILLNKLAQRFLNMLKLFSNVVLNTENESLYNYMCTACCWTSCQFSKNPACRHSNNRDQAFCEWNTFYLWEML